MKLFIVGNKNDQYLYEQVKNDIAEQYAKSINAIYRCVSALESTGINELFDYVARSFFIKRKKEKKIKINENKEKEKQENESKKEFNICPEDEKTKKKKRKKFF